MSISEKINYVEFPAQDIAATKAFFSKAFAWSFEDFGPEYSSFTDAGLCGGFFQSDHKPANSANAALVVLLSDDLEASQAKVEAAGGIIVKQIFSFPGGRRFHFIEPSGNELAVWSS
jgi:predicted enzyme related to lactoylglutathione lyase